MIPRLITRPKDIRSKIAARTMGALVVGRRTLWYAYSGSRLVRVCAERSRELLFLCRRERCAWWTQSPIARIEFHFNSIHQRSWRMLKCDTLERVTFFVGFIIGAVGLQIYTDRAHWMQKMDRGCYNYTVQKTRHQSVELLSKLSFYRDSITQNFSILNKWIMDQKSLQNTKMESRKRNTILLKSKIKKLIMLCEIYVDEYFNCCY